MIGVRLPFTVREGKSEPCTVTVGLVVSNVAQPCQKWNAYVPAVPKKNGTVAVLPVTKAYPHQSPLPVLKIDTQSDGVPGPFCTPRVTVDPAATVIGALLPLTVRFGGTVLCTVTVGLVASLWALPQFWKKRNSYVPGVLGMVNGKVAVMPLT